jgi:mRNA interferase MazF
MVATRFKVYLVNLDPTQGSEIKKKRPAVVISPDEMNKHLATVIIAPMTTKTRAYPTRVDLSFQSKKGQVVLEQIRTIDKTRLVKELGTLSTSTAKKVVEKIEEMFAL